MKYIAPKWLPGGNLQTIWPAMVSARSLADPAKSPASPPTSPYQRVRWATPDDDFIDVDYSATDSPGTKHAAKQPLLVLFHGLEGSSSSHYALAFAKVAQQRGWAYAVPHFRGCSGEINRAPRAYHSGDYEEIGWMLAKLKAAHVLAGGGALLAVGISLGGNALMRWAQEAGSTAAQTVEAVASVCSPLDLAASGVAIGQGFNRLVYTRMFLNSMKPKALERLALNPGLFDAKALAGQPRFVRVRQHLHRPRARLQKHRRLLAARLRQAAHAPHPAARFGAERRERPVYSRMVAAPARRSQQKCDPVAHRAGWPCGLSQRQVSRSK